MRCPPQRASTLCWPPTIQALESLGPCLSALLTLSAGQIAFARAQSPALRIGVRLLYALPAFLVGYQATLDLSNHVAPSEVWRQVFAIIGAIFIGYSAFFRIAQVADTA